MKKTLMALLCVFTLVAFASCSGETPVPENPGNGKFEINIDENLWGTWEILDEDGNPSGSAIYLSQTEFNVGTMLDGEFKPGTSINELYDDAGEYGYPDKAYFADNTNEEAYGFRINLGSKTAYRISVDRTSPSEGTYEYYTISSDGWVSSSISKVAEN